MRGGANRAPPPLRISPKVAGNRGPDRDSTLEMPEANKTRIPIEGKLKICIENGPASVKIEASWDTGADTNTIPEDAARSLGESRYFLGDQPDRRTYHCTILGGANDEKIGRGSLMVFKISQGDKVMLAELPAIFLHAISL